MGRWWKDRELMRLLNGLCATSIFFSMVGYLSVFAPPEHVGGTVLPMVGSIATICGAAMAMWLSDKSSDREEWAEKYEDLAHKFDVLSAKYDLLLTEYQGLQQRLIERINLVSEQRDKE